MFPGFIADEVFQVPPTRFGSVKGWPQENGRCLHGDAYNAAIENCKIAYDIRNRACEAAFLVDKGFNKADFLKAWGKLVVCKGSSDAQYYLCRGQAVEKAPICPSPCDQCAPWGCLTPECGFG